MSFAKAIISNTPRGVNIVTEMDFYYPLPDRISDFDTITDLKKLRKFIPFPAIPDATPAPPTTTATKTIDDLPIPMIIEDSHIYEHPFYDHSSDELQFPNFVKNDHHRNFNLNNLNKNNVKTMNYENHRKNYWLNSKQFWMQNNNKQPFIKNNNYKYIIPTEEQYKNSNRKFNIENFKHWEHYNGHKERRDLFNQLERISIL